MTEAVVEDRSAHRHSELYDLYHIPNMGWLLNNS